MLRLVKTDSEENTVAGEHQLRRAAQCLCRLQLEAVVIIQTPDSVRRLNDENTSHVGTTQGY